MDLHLQGKSVLVTGGSAGIGLACALSMAAEGCDVHLVSRSAERLAEGQLDECDITLRELQDVAASFKSTLRAVYHPRLPYPDPTPEEIAGLARGDSLPGVR